MCVCVFIYISKCQDMCFVEDIKVKGQLAWRRRRRHFAANAAALKRIGRRAEKGAPKTLIFAIYFKPKCEELLLRRIAHRFFSAHGPFSTKTIVQIRIVYHYSA